MAEVRADDGRVIAYEEHGDALGEPIVLFHGAPGSRLFVPGAAPGVRLITFDRPGYGGSDPRPGRGVLDTARDVETLLDALSLGRVAVVGWSGGGPFAAATAVHVGARVTRLGIVSSPGPLDEVPGAWEALGDFRRPTAEMARREPARSERSVARHMEPYLQNPPAFLGSGRGPDGPVLNGPAKAMLVAQVHEALRQGAAGIAEDLIAMWVDWGFRLADIAVETHVWHGALDRDNHSDTETYAARIAGASRTVWPEAGHLGVLTHWPEIVDWLTR